MTVYPLRGAPGTTAEGLALSTLDPRLLVIVGEGAARFEAAYPGITIEVTSGRRYGSKIGAGPHGSKAGALDVQIRAGKDVLPNSGSDTTGLYKRLARYCRGVQMQRYPELAKSFNWGGAFDTFAGSGVPDLMHFDLSGVRGHITTSRITNLEPLGVSS